MKERNSGKVAPAAAFLTLFLAVASQTLASVNISPLRVDLSAGHDKDVITITNQNSTAKSYQVEVVAWSQTAQQREVYAPTEDVLAVPPLFTLDPGEEQIIRVGMLTGVDPRVEKTYRLFITELADPNEDLDTETGISMRLQIGVPVFIAPTALPTANLTFIDLKTIDGQQFVGFRNNGNTHVKVTELGYSAPGSDEVTRTPTVMYFLAGNTGYLPLEDSEGIRGGTITVVTDSLGEMEYELPLAP